MSAQNISLVRNTSLVRRAIASVVALGMMAGASSILAQQASDAGAVTPVGGSQVPNAAATTATPALDADGKPMATALGGKKAKKIKKEKAPKLTSMSVVEGTLTVDGWTGKARMNYDIADLKYLYLWAPEVGTVVVSNVKFPQGKEQAKAFSGNTLTVDANGHTIQLTSEKRLLRNPASAWVYVDTAYRVASAYPAMGFGTSAQAPYAWPGAKSVQAAKARLVDAPPLPKALLPALAATGCSDSETAGTPCAASGAGPIPAPSTVTPPVSQAP